MPTRLATRGNSERYYHKVGQGVADRHNPMTGSEGYLFDPRGGHFYFYILLFLALSQTFTIHNVPKRYVFTLSKTLTLNLLNLTLKFDRWRNRTILSRRSQLRVSKTLLNQTFRELQIKFFSDCESLMGLLRSRANEIQMKRISIL